jgi:hypothetical protein
MQRNPLNPVPLLSAILALGTLSPFFATAAPKDTSPSSPNPTWSVTTSESMPRDLAKVPFPELQAIQQLTASAHRLGLVYDRRTSRGLVARMMTAAAANNVVSLQAADVAEERDIPAAVRYLLAEGIDAMVLPDEPRFRDQTIISYFVMQTMEKYVPLVVLRTDAVRYGAALGLGQPVPTSSAMPQGLPFRVGISLRVCRTLNLTPQQSMVSNAALVIP